ncbi:MAG: sulfatase-like hydrolase/transferase [Verrucomicrobia bacterium]|nr:sulfatase-like hydrolase/transferase [Verrucomicrobiota bacterium]
MTREAQRPNILWICTDQQRFDTLGCTGNGFVRTPHVNGLARDGVLFENAFCQNPVCTPSRASFLTGRYPRTTRCRQNGQSIPADEVLVTRLLHDAGYTGGLSGKLHISACDPTVCKNTERRINDGYDVFHWSHHPGADWPGNEYMQWLDEKGVALTRTPVEGAKHMWAGMPAEHHQTTWCAEKAISFIEQADRSGRPWFFSVNIFDPHHEFDPPREHLERYLARLDEIPLPNYLPGELDGKPVWQAIDHQRAYAGTSSGYAYDTMSDREHRLIRAAYWAMVDLIDDQVGRMLDALDRSGQRDNTLVLFMSDHGEMLGDHGIYLKGAYFYEPAVHVPLIVSWPARIEPARRSTALAELTDIAPTLLEAAGLPRAPGMQGRSLWPVLTGHADPSTHRDDVYCEYYNANQHYKTPAHLTMVRTERHKLVVPHGRAGAQGHLAGELYDLDEDPNETHNRWHDPAHHDIRHQMMLRLCDRMAWTVDPLPIREGNW